MLTLNDLSKQANDLYNKFVDDYNQTELEYLDEMQHKLDMLADMDDDEMVYSTGHFDEQTLDAYWSAKDEDGAYIHPYNDEIN